MRVPITVFDLGPSMDSLAQVAVITLYADAYHERSWSDVGTFEIRIDPRIKYADELLEGRLVMFGDVRKAGLIEEVTLTEDEGGQSKVVIGHEAKILLDRRWIVPPAGLSHYRDSAAVEAVMKSLVSSQMGPTADADRIAPILSIVASSNRGATYTLSSRYTNQLDELAKASAATGFGFLLWLNLGTKKLVFDVGVGVDRTASQNTNPRAIFAKKFGSVKSLERKDAITNYRNLAIVAGQGQGTARTVITATQEGATPTGLARRELFVDARDLASADLPARAAAKLAEKSQTSFLSGTALSESSLVLDRDYTLGDLVTVSGFDISEDVRLTGIRESWSESGYSIDHTFGDAYPTSQLADSVSELSASLQDSETP